uniref:Uncharacterized protein n=1 Tax=Ornithorhynchus anatinus TaxID=9258 RepID=A0A6I8NJT6_ORNAN
MAENGSLRNGCEIGGCGSPLGSEAAQVLPRMSSWVAPALTVVLIVTEDLVGNPLVILSVLRNRKLHNMDSVISNPERSLMTNATHILI